MFAWKMKTMGFILFLYLSIFKITIWCLSNFGEWPIPVISFLEQQMHGILWIWYVLFHCNSKTFIIFNFMLRPAHLDCGHPARWVLDKIPMVMGSPHAFWPHEMFGLTWIFPFWDLGHCSFQGEIVLRGHFCVQGVLIAIRWSLCLLGLYSGQS